MSDYLEFKKQILKCCAEINSDGGLELAASGGLASLSMEDLHEIVASGDAGRLDEVREQIEKLAYSEGYCVGLKEAVSRILRVVQKSS